MLNALVPSSVRLFILITLCALFAPAGAWAIEKDGMPDLTQTEATCLPTSTANLMIWFGHHGYPKMLPLGGTEEDRDWSVIQHLMTDTNARFDLGTERAREVSGIEKYIRDAGYGSDVEFRGVLASGETFSLDWLKQNDQPDTGFILILAYCRWNPDTRVLTPALRVGHAVTLVNAEPDFLLVHDPGHLDNETGRKILTPTPLSQATLQDGPDSEPADGAVLLDGSLLHAPDDARVVLVGAIRVTIHENEKEAVAATPSHHNYIAANAVPPWWACIFRFFFAK